MTQIPFLLAAEGLNKSFAGFHAIRDLSFYLDEGELRTVIGPNGAGKTTFLDLITGRTRPDTGTLEFSGNHNLLNLTEYEIYRLGIGRKFQTPTVYTDHTVFENLVLSLEGSRGVFRSLISRTTSTERDRIADILKTINLTDRAKWKAGALAHGQKQWLEIGMLLMQEPRLLLVDEPVAGMTPAEMDRTAELLKSLAGSHSVVVVEHDMGFVRSIADKVTVLHQGRVLAEGQLDELQIDPTVIEVYLGTNDAYH